MNVVSTECGNSLQNSESLLRNKNGKQNNEIFQCNIPLELKILDENDIKLKTFRSRKSCISA